MAFSDMGYSLPIIALNTPHTYVPYETFNLARAINSSPSTINVDSSSILAGEGKPRKCVVHYIPDQCDAAVDCSTFDPCTLAGSPIEPDFIEFEVTQCIASSSFSFTQEQFRLINGDVIHTDYAIAMLNAVLPNFRKNIAFAMTSRLYNLAGSHADGSITKRVVTTNAANGIVNPIGKYQIEREYLDSGFNSPLLYGGGEIYNWQKMVAIGGLNASGQRIDGISTAGSFYDNGLSQIVMDDAANGGWILSIDPARVRFITYNKNAGIFRTDIQSETDFTKMVTSNWVQSYMKGSFYDAVTGFVYDLYGNINCGKLTYQLVFNWDWFIAPGPCGIYDLNGLMKWRTCPEETATCP